ncbi:MAG: 30S ribosomal protein S4 [Candidatus Omnitrophica bacterium]|nr:30S ribosomal protein S4 [Candidatus Omnitrophota bacterium]
MARYRGPKYRLCRREGVNLFGPKKYDFDIRPFPPGQHGQGRRTKLSDYGLQLREKQKVKRVYGILERQFRRYYLKAAQSKGITGSVLLQFLERRLDNVIFRLGFALTRPQARQMVGHGLVQVNGKRVNIPSFLVKEGDQIEIKVNDKTKEVFIDKTLDKNKDLTRQSWLKMDEKGYKATVIRLPQREDLQFPINEQLIIELYSK